MCRNSSLVLFLSVNMRWCNRPLAAAAMCSAFKGFLEREVLETADSHDIFNVSVSFVSISVFKKTEPKQNLTRACCQEERRGFPLCDEQEKAFYCCCCCC